MRNCLCQPDSHVKTLKSFLPSSQPYIPFSRHQLVLGKKTASQQPHPQTNKQKKKNLKQVNTRWACFPWLIFGHYEQRTLSLRRYCTSLIRRWRHLLWRIAPIYHATHSEAGRPATSTKQYNLLHPDWIPRGTIFWFNICSVVNDPRQRLQTGFKTK